MKYKLYIQSLIEVEIEANSKGEAQQQLFRNLEDNYYDSELRNKSIVGFVNNEVEENKDAPIKTENAQK